MLKNSNLNSDVFFTPSKELEDICLKENIEHTYFIKSGFRDGLQLSNSKNLIHAVFPTNWQEFHGDKLAFVSEWLSKEHGNFKIPFVPHMIDLKPIWHLSIKQFLKHLNLEKISFSYL